jgi:hypothetical protein
MGTQVIKSYNVAFYTHFKLYTPSTRNRLRTLLAQILSFASIIIYFALKTGLGYIITDSRDSTTQNPLKLGGEFRCSRRVPLPLVAPIVLHVLKTR